MIEGRGGGVAPRSELLWRGPKKEKIGRDEELLARIVVAERIRRHALHKEEGDRLHPAAVGAGDCPWSHSRCRCRDRWSRRRSCRNSGLQGSEKEVFSSLGEGRLRSWIHSEIS